MSRSNALVLVAALAGALTGCGNREPEVRLVIPDDYSGALTVVEQAGAPPLPKESGQFVIRFERGKDPAFANLDVLARKYYGLAEYASGLKIPQRYRINHPTDERMVFGPELAGEAGSRTASFFVGDLETYNAWRKAKGLSPDPYRPNAKKATD